MSDTQKWTVRDIDAGTVDDIRQMAVRFHVPQARVVEEAVYWFRTEVGRSVDLPDDWTRPRDF